jgi:hypothetical protein
MQSDSRASIRQIGVATKIHAWVQRQRNVAPPCNAVSVRDEGCFPICSYVTKLTLRRLLDAGACCADMKEDFA